MIIGAYRKMSQSLEKVESILLIILFLSLTAVSFIQVICRYFLAYPTPWAEELARYFFVYATYIGAATAVYHRSHIDINMVDIIYGKLFKTKESAEHFYLRLDIVNIAVTVLFISVFAYQSYHFLLTVYAMGQYSPAINMNMVIPMSCLLIGSCLMVIHLINNIMNNLLTMQRKGE